MISTYFSEVERLLKQVLTDEQKPMRQAAEKISESIQNGGIVHLFGCGHSHILSEEVFYRAGGLVPISPVFHEPLMLHEGAVRSSQLERKNHYADTFLKDLDIQKEDVFIAMSTSGRNPVPIDAAIFAKEKGAYVIGLTSREYSTSQPSRHKSGKRLLDVVDLVIDNHSVKGDAILSHELVKEPFTPTSTVVGSTILDAIFSEAVVNMAKNQFEPPVFLSGNIDGADEHNEALIEKYGKRIPLLLQNKE